MIILVWFYRCFKYIWWNICFCCFFFTINFVNEYKYFNKEREKIMADFYLFNKMDIIFWSITLINFNLCIRLHINVITLKCIFYLPTVCNDVKWLFLLLLLFTLNFNWKPIKYQYCIVFKLVNQIKNTFMPNNIQYNTPNMCVYVCNFLIFINSCWVSNVLCRI